MEIQPITLSRTSSAGEPRALMVVATNEAMTFSIPTLIAASSSGQPIW